MANKRAAALSSGGKGSGAAARRVATPATPDAAAGRKSRGKQASWPWWLWVVGAFALIASLGRILAREPGGKKPGRPAGKKASSAARFLELALRLQEMTDLATALEAGGALDSDAAQELDKELTNIEGEIADGEGSVARDLRSMVSVVRGTLYQRGQKLTDEQVERLGGNAFTYANPRYWDDYYTKTSGDEKFDWYGSWDTAITETTFTPQGATKPQSAATVGEMLRPYLRPEDKVLMFGCGNSDMSEKMYVAGFQGIVNIDISERLLENLRARLSAAMPRMRWLHMNASDLAFPDAEFDVTIDKGTLDAIEQNGPLLAAAAREAHRTLRPGGYFLSITFNGAPVRVDRQLREAAEWGGCQTHPFERPNKERGKFFVHACQKRSL